MVWRGCLVCCTVIICLLKYAEGQGDLCEDGTCYRYIRTAARWVEAADICNQQGSLLVTVPNANAQAAIRKAMKYEDAAESWLGGFNEMNDQEKVLLWRWLDGVAAQYQGCFYEFYTSITAHEYNLASPNITDLVPDLCIQACKNYKFAKLRYGNNCTCTNKVQYIKNSRCDSPCAGDGNLTCGGEKRRADVYLSKGMPVGWVNTTKLHNIYSNCGYLMVNTITNITGFDHNLCEEKKPYLCDIASASCRNSTTYVWVGAQCVHTATLAKSWYKAHEECLIKGGTLSMPKTDEQLDALKELIINLSSSNGPNYLGAQNGQVELWVGLARQYFLWLNKETINGRSAQSILNSERTNNQITYTNFAPNQPIYSESSCLRVTQADDYRWSEVTCDQKKTYFCVYDMPTTTSTTTTTPTTTTTTKATTTTQVTTTVNASINSTAATTIATTTTQLTSTTPAVTTSGTTVTPEPGASTQAGGLEVWVTVLIVIIIILIIIAIIVIIVCVVWKKKKGPVRPDPTDGPVVFTSGGLADSTPRSIPPAYEDVIKSDAKDNNVIVDASTVDESTLGANPPNGTSGIPLAIPETDRSERSKKKKKKKKKRQEYETASTLVLETPRKGVDPLPVNPLTPRRIRQNYRPMNRPLAEPLDKSSGDEWKNNNNPKIYIP